MIPSQSNDAHFMGCALELAQRAWGQTHPNPMVGAVIVEGGTVVAQGWHHRAGEAHAEVEALRALGRQPSEEAILYVTLEPCSTCGRTGACTDAIIESGIRRVVVGVEDQNPAHAGRGLGVLRAAGGARLVPLRRRGETRDRGELALTVGTLWRFPPPKPLP